MSRDVNKVILIGRLGKDPVKRETKTGRVVAHFSLATSHRRRAAGESDGEQGELKEETQWHRISAFGSEGQRCATYLRKGNWVYVEGTLRSSRYTGKDGVMRESFEVFADHVNFLGGWASRSSSAENGEQTAAASAIETAQDEPVMAAAV